MKILIALLCAYLIYVLLEKAYSKMWNKGLESEIKIQNKTAYEGDENKLFEIVTNKKFLPLPMLKVRFRTHKNITFGRGENAAKSDNNYRADIFSMLPYQKITRTLPFECKKRGYYVFDDFSISSSDPLMMQRFIQNFDISESVLIYPKGVDSEKLEIPFSKMIGMVISKRFSYEDPFEFRTIRQYQPFDSMRDVNWKASAKTDSLLVNAHNYTVDEEASLLVNFDSDTTVADEGLKEEALQIASSLAERFTDEGIPVSMYTNGRDMITMEEPTCKTGSGKAHALTIKEALARIDFDLGGRRFIDKFREITQKADKNIIPVMITPSVDCDMQNEYFQSFPNNSIWIVVHRPDFVPKAPENKNCLVILWEVQY